VTTVALVFYSQYYTLIQNIFDALVTKRLVMAAFVITLVVVPLVALLI